MPLKIDSPRKIRIAALHELRDGKAPYVVINNVIREMKYYYNAKIRRIKSSGLT